MISKGLKVAAKALAKKKGRPKVDKRKTKGKRKAQSAARQKTFQAKQTEAAEKAGKSKAALAQERAIERKSQTIRGKDIDSTTKTNAIKIVEESKGKLTAAEAIKKAQSSLQDRMTKVKSRARSETAKLRSKGAFKGFSEEQMKERKNLIASALREMSSKGDKKVIAGRTLSLNPAGEKLIKQKGGIDKILEKPRRYLYETMNETLPAKGALSKYEGATKAETRKNIKSAFEEMSKPQKLEFLQKRFAPSYTTKQLEDVFYQGKAAPDIKGKSRTQIEGLRNRLKDKGLLPALGETRRGTGSKQGKALVKEIKSIKKEAQNIREKDIPKVETKIERAQEALTRAKTSEAKTELRSQISKLKQEKTRLTNLASNVEKGKVTKAKKRLSKMPPQTGSTQSFYTTTKKGGGKVGGRGCGKALRGYGKVMKGKR